MLHWRGLPRYVRFHGRGQARGGGRPGGGTGVRRHGEAADRTRIGRRRSHRGHGGVHEPRIRRARGWRSRAGGPRLHERHVRQRRAGDRQPSTAARRQDPAREPRSSSCGRPHQPREANHRPRQIPNVPLLVFASGQMAGEEVPVGGQVVVGRDPGAADVILDQDGDVSRRHATFSPSGAGLTVEDLGSTNGTFVNGHRLTATVPLNTGDRVELGDTVIEIRLAAEPAPPPPVAAPAPAAPERPAQRHRRGGPRQGVRRQARGGRGRPPHQPGRDLRLPRAERSREVDHRPHAHDPDAAHRGHSARGRTRRRQAGVEGPPRDRRRAAVGGARPAAERLGAHGPSDGAPGAAEGAAQAARPGADRASRPGRTPPTAASAVTRAG